MNGTKRQSHILLLACWAFSLLGSLIAIPTPSAAETPTYRNPILFADYSDPDVIRDGKDYYLVASTFHFVPGIPILHSTDLVHWTILGHVVERMEMDPRYDLTEGNRYGGGIWAPAIRKHNGRFYVYFPTPDEGIFVSTASAITGPWTKPVAVIAQPHLEDPCPFWDDNGNAYLVHSRTGAGPLILHRMSKDGLKVLDEGKVIVNDREHLPVLEGPKMYKRNGYYYIFAPFGGVGSGSQVVLRSRNIDGPYDYRVVLSQFSTPINGPHQGGYVETPAGEGWFIHFQSRGAHGRIVHLEPVRWKDDWPIIGKPAGDGDAGEPVSSAPLPIRLPHSHQTPQTSDEFGNRRLSPQWEWNHNPDNAHWSLHTRPGFLRLTPLQANDLLGARNTLTQCMQDNSFVLTVRMDLSGMKSGVRAGLAMLQQSPNGLQIVQTGTERHIVFFKDGIETPGPEISQPAVQLRVRIEGEQATYFYSSDEGKEFQQLGAPSTIAFSWWKGARPALFAYTTKTENPGFIDVDWAHYERTGENLW